VAGATLDAAVSGPLVPALAVSVALHAAVLAGLPDLWTPATAPAPPLMAWLAPGAPPATAPEAAPPATPEPSAAAPVRPRASPKPAPATALARAPAPASPPAPAAALPAAEPIAVAPAASAPRPAAADTVVVAAAAPSAPAADVGSLIAQYRFALLGAARQEKSYPAGAVDRGLAGRVEIRLAIGSDGRLAGAQVMRSSGHEVLDRQTLETFRAAHARTPVPPALRDREFAVDVAVRYELRDAR
jgi:protein TonB